MNLLASVVVYENNIVDSFYYFLESKEKLGYQNAPTTKEIQKFNSIVDFIKENFSFFVKIELINFGGEFIIRIKKENILIDYKIFSFNDDLYKINLFLKKSIIVKNKIFNLKNGNYNLIIGKFAEKFVHEWLSHPAEANLKTHSDFILKNNNEFKNSNRLTNIKYQGNTHIKIPKNFLYLRYVNKGYYSINDKKIKINIKEAFMKKNGLIQSVYPFSCSFHIDDLNKGFKGVISNTKYNSGFFCTKNNITVFGKVESNFLMFKNIKVEPEENYYE